MTQKKDFTLREFIYSTPLVRKILLFIAVLASGILGAFLASAMRGEEPIVVHKQTFDAERLRISLQDSGAWPYLKIGEAFPNKNCTLPDGTYSTIHQIIYGKPSLLIFWHPGCETCVDLSAYWSLHITPAMSDKVQVIACTSPNEMALVKKHYDNGMFEGSKRVFIDLDALSQEYNMILYPTIICTDRTGEIVLIQAGFPEELDEDIISFATNAG